MQRILAAAADLFGRNGFQRTSMADIAREAGIARATLYLRFSEKRAVFEALAAAVVDGALNAAEAASDAAAPLSKNLAETMLAKELVFFRILRNGAYGAEMMALQAEISPDQAHRLSSGYGALLLRRGAEAAVSGADLSAFGGPDGFAAFLLQAGSGLKYEMHTEVELREAIERLSMVAARAAGQS